MNTLDLNTTALSHTAVAALKKAYEGCADKAVKDSIITEYKAILQLHHNIEKYISDGSGSERNYGSDASEYCAAV